MREEVEVMLAPTPGGGKSSPTLWVLALATGAYVVRALVAPALVAAVWSSSPASAAERIGSRYGYIQTLKDLKPGDTLRLRAGAYYFGLPLHGIQGTAEAPIVITGPEDGTATFYARADGNTVSLKNASHLVIRNLTLDGQHLDADAVKAEGNSDYAHHITLENLRIIHHDADQSTVGISTKCPAWNWVVRNNRIERAGTGMYFGDSDGSAPFFASVIEGNEILDTAGYNIEIKHQNPRPALAEMPAGASQTVIRGNVFRKASNASAGDLARPNLLVGHWPLRGPGSEDRYLIHDNTFHQNPSGEPLFQGEGRLALYHNVLVNDAGSAVWIQPHHDRPRQVDVFRNTVVARDDGIRITAGASPPERLSVWGNAVFAATPLAGVAAAGNFTAPYAQAATHLRDPGGAPGALDARPRAGHLRAGRLPAAPDYAAGADRNATPGPEAPAVFGALAE